ncbi:hypothetical protein COCSUDRAFT_57137 [Coccomyxa subellipsoidea C-169]|uniref:Uncharacterized protein n=1 Tax=Coccomyxa subellipsoidea (strain C-169) TaxID=574566 RepID=I0YS60_COCSC|nr:hypothetical protein COCSUDRAFT_57137 [Coccomyxa subellipsoidea C-169]EIE21229.1 hypothetical protein COCSUDRAFT_57137 [Coccomyxa subellipsoidea C-169]|eukprot:XP_005645773.1 hypothetical protein COCSUDRAFT_57137 [Coccomyxa subellipsoidea C-169]
MAGLDIEVNDGDTGRQHLVSLIDKVSNQQDSDPKVEHLTLSFLSPDEKHIAERGGNHPVLVLLVGLIKLCAGNLRTLTLKGIPMGDYFDLRKSNGSSGDPKMYQPLLGALCACTQLKSLYVSRRDGDTSGDHSRLVMAVAESLPSLRTLQWRCLKKNGAERPTPFSSAFLAALAETPKPGLRLLQIDDCAFDAYNKCPKGGYILPASLQVLALYNQEQYFHGRLKGLLHNCCNLEELYLCHFHTNATAPPNFDALWSVLQNLRVLVLDVVNCRCDSSGWEAVHAVPRCPMLKNLAVGFLEPEHMPWFRAFLAFGGEKLQRLQLQLSIISFDPEDDFESEDEEDRDPDRCPTEDESEWESSEGDFDEENQSDPDAYPYWGQRIKRQPFDRPPPRPRQKFERVLGSLEWTSALEHLQLTATLVDRVWSLDYLPQLATIGIFVDHNEGLGTDLKYGPSTKMGTLRYFSKAFGRMQDEESLPALRKIYFHPVQRAYRRFQGEAKPPRGAEEFKFKSVALEDPGRTMGKAWLRAPPGAQAAEGLSRAFASLNFERGLRGGARRLGYLYDEYEPESSDDEGFGQNAELDDGELTAPGWRHLYVECISEGWPSDEDDYGDDVSSDDGDDASADEDDEVDSQVKSSFGKQA